MLTKLCSYIIQITIIQIKEEVKGEETVENEFIELILAKHRSGKVGRIVLLFDKEIQKFRNP